MSEEDFIDDVEIGAGASVITDDGRDWTAWLVWNMNSRRRISERLFVLPPARPIVSKPVVRPTVNVRRRKRKANAG
ncbi:hypothetical protein GTGU_04788 [Trabulsiella guamensis ATCC 49490]|uniref:Uncharacterized protein n=1 Tax=Trabulsiella guamensis ATCC 49490 TaxID=1005994 RepID=A0A084Z0H0_9ENTR|nr:hypothetical protein [Trabulsiella guamensis]KFB90964.1 hypothetical protein GTGU_04788 [Trabulsiella guamensis ATCC 49490]